MPKTPSTSARFAVAVLALLHGCRGGPEERGPVAVAPAGTVTGTAEPSQEQLLQQRRGERRLELLARLIAIDQREVTLSEQQLAHVRSLYDAGRIANEDLLEAERALLASRRRLLEHECERDALR